MSSRGVGRRRPSANCRDQRSEKGIVATREKYRAYIADILRLGEVADAETKAEAIFKLESEIADIQHVDRGYEDFEAKLAEDLVDDLRLVRGEGEKIFFFQTI